VDGDIPLERFGLRWSATIVRGVRALDELPEDDVAHLSYEDLLDRPQRQLARALEFFGLAKPPDGWLDQVVKRIRSRGEEAAGLDWDELERVRRACLVGERCLERLSTKRLGHAQVRWWGSASWDNEKARSELTVRPRLTDFSRAVIRRLTYANVIASLALVGALAGASYAALSLPANSVGPSQLRPGAVTLGKLGFLLGSSGTSIKQVTLPGQICRGNPPPPCIHLPPKVIVSVPVTLSHPGALLVLGSMEVVNDDVGNGAAQLQLGDKLRSGPAYSDNSSYQVTTGVPTTVNYQHYLGHVPAGRHLIDLFADETGPSVTITNLQAVVIEIPKRWRSAVGER
jgi:hypothetical protein